MTDAREWFEIGDQEFPNLEEATKTARAYAAQSDLSVDIYRVTRVPVRCVKREVSVKETDLPEAPKA